MDSGSLYSILKNYFPSGIKSMPLVASMLKQVLLGLKYLHENNFIHREVKS